MSRGQRGLTLFSGLDAPRRRVCLVGLSRLLSASLVMPLMVLAASSCMEPMVVESPERGVIAVGETDQAVQQLARVGYRFIRSGFALTLNRVIDRGELGEEPIPC